MPGAITLTVMCWGPSSRASAREKPTTAAFAAAYAAKPVCRAAWSAPAAAKFTMRPLPLALRCGSAARMQKYIVSVFCENWSCHSSGVVSSNGFFRNPPTLHTRMSREPKRSTTSRTRPFAPSSVVRSAPNAAASPPEPLICSASSSARSLLRT